VSGNLLDFNKNSIWSTHVSKNPFPGGKAAGGGAVHPLPSTNRRRTIPPLPLCAFIACTRVTFSLFSVSKIS